MSGIGMSTVPQAVDFVPHHMDHAMLLERPELTACIALIAIRWNRVDEEISGLAIALLSNSELVAGGAIQEMMRDVINYQLRIQLIQAIGRVRLPIDMYEELCDLCEEAKDRSKERSDIVHGLWQVPFHIEDALVRLPSSVEMKIGWRRPRRKSQRAKDQPAEAYQGTKYHIYKKDDFEAVEARLINFQERIVEFVIRCVERRMSERR